MRFERDVMLLI